MTSRPGSPLGESQLMSMRLKEERGRWSVTKRKTARASNERKREPHPSGSTVPPSHTLFKRPLPSFPTIFPPGRPSSSMEKQTCLVSPGFSNGVSAKRSAFESSRTVLSDLNVRPWEGSKSILEKKSGSGEVFWMWSSRKMRERREGERVVLGVEGRWTGKGKGGVGQSNEYEALEERHRRSSPFVLTERGFVTWNLATGRTQRRRETISPRFSSPSAFSSSSNSLVDLPEASFRP